MKKLCFFLITLFLNCFLFISCDNQSSVLEINDLPQPIYVGKCVIDQDCYDIDNVSPIFYYGGYFSPNIEHENLSGNNIPSFDMFFYAFKSGFNWDTSIEYKIRHVDENFVSEKYRITDAWFNERITIPKELFLHQSGGLCFCIKGTYVGIDYLGNEVKSYDGILSVYLKYEYIEDNKIILTNV